MSSPRRSDSGTASPTASLTSRLTRASAPYSPSQLPTSAAVTAVPFAPTFYPTAAEFVHPYAYIRSIRSEAQLYGIVKIVPPKEWKFDCALDFDGVRFGTKAQRIDMLMQRGTGSGEQDEAQCKGQRKGGRGRRGSGAMKGRRGSGVEENRQRPGRPRRMKAGEESKEALSDANMDAAEERKEQEDEDDTATAKEIRRSPRTTTSLNRNNSGSPHSSPVRTSSLIRLATTPVTSPEPLLHVVDEASFWSCLRRFHGPSRRIPEPLCLADTQLPVKLYELYRVVDGCGGVARVAAGRGWRDAMSVCGVAWESQTQGMHRKFEKLWNEWLDGFWKAVKREERAMDDDTKATPTAVAAGAGDDDVELMDDSEWQSQSQKRKRELNMDAAEGNTEAALRRSKRERKSLMLDSLHASSAPLIEEVCRHCGQFDHHTHKMRCSTCNAVFHCFCLSPPLQAPPAPSASPYVCRSCVEEEEGLFGFEAGGLYTLSAFQRQADAFKQRYFHLQPDSPAPTAAQIATEFWRIVEGGDHSSPVCVEYGSDLDTQETGSVYPQSGPIANDGWNLRNLPRLSSSVLTALDDTAIEGISIPWLYVGMLFSAFCWHNEDHYSYSINYVAAGDDKQWYGVAAQHANAFERAMAAKLPHLFNHSPDLLFHLITMLPPTTLQTDLTIYQLTQKAGEIVLTFPQAYHAGFNCGFNVAESVNFAPIDWLSFGLQCSLRYRFFHRQPVWCSEQVVLKSAQELIRQWKERHSKGRKEEDDDKRCLKNGELPLWERAAWLLPALCRLRDEEYELRRRLYMSGTVRMQPWPAAADSSNTASSIAPAANSAFRMGDLVQVESEQANMRLWKSGVMVAIVCDGLYRVKLTADGLVREVDERSMRRQHRDEEKRTHEWDEYQNVGIDGAVVKEDESKEQEQTSRPPRMSGSAPPATASAQPSKPSTVVPRCLICGHFLYLSCVRCSCTIDKPVCLSHASELCGCAAQSKFGWFRFSLQQLDEWCDVVQTVVQAERRRVDGGSSKWRYVSKHRHNDKVMHIMNESEAILHRSDDYILAMHKRLRHNSLSASDATTPIECVDTLSSTHPSVWSPTTVRAVPAWTAEVEQRWVASSEEWLSAHKPLLELEQPAFSASELDTSMKLAERFIWADARMSPVYDVYRVFSTWQSQGKLLSMSLCSLISAHHYLLSLASSLIKAIAGTSPAASASPSTSPTSSSSPQPSLMTLLTELFLPSPSVGGWLSIARAETLLSSIEHCPLHLSCVCDSIEGRYQREGQKERKRAADGLARRDSRNEQRVAGHMRLLAKLLSVAKEQQAQVGRKEKGPMPTLLPRSECTALNEPALNAISVACSAVVIDSRAQVLKWGKQDALLALKPATAATEPAQHTNQTASPAANRKPPPAAASKPSSPAAVSPSAAKSSATASARSVVSVADRPGSHATRRFNLSDLPQLQSQVTNCDRLKEPLNLTPSVERVEVAQSDIRRMDMSSDWPKQQVTWIHAAEAALLSAPGAQPPTMPHLIALYRTFDAAFNEPAAEFLAKPQGARVRGAALVLLLMLHERLVAATLWSSHCKRLLCTGGNRLLAEEGWGDSKHSRCACKPMLTFSGQEPPHLCFCDCAQSSNTKQAPQTASSQPVHSSAPIRRFRVCCANTLLACPIVSFVDLADAPLLRQAKDQTVEWANRALRLIAPLPASTAKPPVAAAPTYVTLPYLHGLALEGDHVPFVSPATAEVRAHIGLVQEFQRRVLSQVDNIRRAMEERREEEATALVTIDRGSYGSSKVAESTRAPRRAGGTTSPAGRTASPSAQSAPSSCLLLTASDREWWQCCQSMLEELLVEGLALRLLVEESRWCKRYKRDIQYLLKHGRTQPHTPASQPS